MEFLRTGQMLRAIESPLKVVEPIALAAKEKLVPHKAALLKDINQVIARKYAEIVDANPPETPLFDIYSELAHTFSSRVAYKPELNRTAIKAIGSPEPGETRMGSHVLITINLNSILGVIEPYLTSDTDRNNDLIQEVLTEIYGRQGALHMPYPSMQLNAMSLQVVRRFIAREYDVPMDLIKKGISEEVDQAINKLMANYPKGLRQTVIDQYATALNMEFGIPADILNSYINERSKKKFGNVQFGNPDPMYDQVEEPLIRQKIARMITGLTTKQQYVIEGRFLRDMTIENLAREMKVSKQKITDIEIAALKKLKDPLLPKDLKRAPNDTP